MKTTTRMTTTQAPLSFRLDSADRDRLRWLQRNLRLNRTDVVRMAIRELSARRGRGHHVADRLDAIRKRLPDIPREQMSQHEKDRADLLAEVDRLTEERRGARDLD